MELFHPGRGSQAFVVVVAPRPAPCTEPRSGQFAAFALVVARVRRTTVGETRLFAIRTQFHGNEFSAGSEVTVAIDRRED